jgi:hypothetical protein
MADQLNQNESILVFCVEHFKCKEISTSRLKFRLMTMYPNQSMLVTLECSEFELNGCCFAEKTSFRQVVGLESYLCFVVCYLRKGILFFYFA